MMAMAVLVAAALLLAGVALGAPNNCRNEPQCRVTRIHGMKSADCYKLDLRHFPKCLTADAEVIDLTYNRIRDMKKQDLDKYKNLKFLYLAENMITKIDPEALSDKTELQTLDLSYNAFSNDIPKVIFHLPSLKNLYLSQNQNINIISIIENAAPITSPLVKLDISFNTEEPQSLPNLGIVPTLYTYNVSGMELVMRPGDTAGLCNLNYFVTDNVTSYFEDKCDCWHTRNWLKMRKVHFTPFNCEIEEDECPFQLSEEDVDTFTRCKQLHAERIYQAKMNTTLMAAGIVLAIIFVIFLFVLWRWRRRVRKRRELKDAILSYNM